MRALVYEKEGHPDEAIADLQMVISLNASDIETRIRLGILYGKTGSFSKAIELNQTYTNAYINRGNLYVRTGRNVLAMADFRKACDLKNERGCNALRTLQKAAGQ